MTSYFHRRYTHTSITNLHIQCNLIVILFMLCIEKSNLARFLFIQYVFDSDIKIKKKKKIIRSITRWCKHQRYLQRSQGFYRVLGNLVTIHKCSKHETFSCFKKYVSINDTSYVVRSRKCRLPIIDVAIWISKQCQDIAFEEYPTTKSTITNITCFVLYHLLEESERSNSLLSFKKYSLIHLLVTYFRPITLFVTNYLGF